MIDLDSPVAAVLGAQTKAAKAKKITEGLGLHTVGDLLFHFPRRYVRCQRAYEKARKKGDPI